MRLMRSVLIISCLAAALLCGFTQGENAGLPAAAAATGSTATNPWTDRAQAAALVQSYLEREKREWTVDTSGEYTVYTATVKMTNATHRLRIVIDPEKGLVYLFLNRYLSCPADSPALSKLLQRLMEENWNLNIGKFEWDKTDGEIRYSYCFTTENGVGYESFHAITTTLLDTGDKLWPELRKVGGE